MADKTLDEILASMGVVSGEAGALAPKGKYEAGALSFVDQMTGGMLPFMSEAIAPIEKGLYNTASEARQWLGAEALPEYPEVNAKNMREAIAKGKSDYPIASNIGEGGAKAGQFALGSMLMPFAAPYLGSTGMVPAAANAVTSGVAAGAPKILTDYLTGAKSGTEASKDIGTDVVLNTILGPLGSQVGRAVKPGEALVAESSKQLPKDILDPTLAHLRTARATGAQPSAQQAIEGAGRISGDYGTIAKSKDIGDATANIASRSGPARNRLEAFEETVSPVSQARTQDWLGTQPGRAAAGEAAEGTKVPVSRITPQANQALVQANKIVKQANAGAGDSPVAIRMAQDGLRRRLEDPNLDQLSRADLEHSIASLDDLLVRRAPDTAAAPGIRAAEPHAGAANVAAGTPARTPTDRVMGLLEGAGMGGMGVGSAYLLGHNPAMGLLAAGAPVGIRAGINAGTKQMNKGAEDAVSMLLTKPEQAFQLFGKRTGAQMKGEASGDAISQLLQALFAQSPIFSNLTR